MRSRYRALIDVIISKNIVMNIEKNREVYNRPLAKLKNYVLIAQKTRGRNQVSSDKSLII
jgi:hypothetical protein